MCEWGAAKMRTFLKCEPCQTLNCYYQKPLPLELEVHPNTHKQKQFIKKTTGTTFLYKKKPKPVQQWRKSDEMQTCVYTMFGSTGLGKNLKIDDMSADINPVSKTSICSLTL